MAIFWAISGWITASADFLSFLWSAEQYLQTQLYTEYTSGLLHRVIFYAALHFLIPACIYFDTLFTSFTVLEHRNLCEDKVQYSPFLDKMDAMAVLVLVNRNGTNFDAEDVNCQSKPVVRSYLSFWVCYKLRAWTVAYHYCSWACIPKLTEITPVHPEL